MPKPFLLEAACGRPQFQQACAEAAAAARKAAALERQDGRQEEKAKQEDGDFASSTHKVAKQLGWTAVDLYEGHRDGDVELLSSRERSLRSEHPMLTERSSLPSLPLEHVSDEEELSDWIKESLALRRSHFVCQVQDMVNRHLAVHHKHLFSDVEHQLAMVMSRQRTPTSVGREDSRKHSTSFNDLSRKISGNLLERMAAATPEQVHSRRSSNASTLGGKQCSGGSVLGRSVPLVTFAGQHSEKTVSAVSSVTSIQEEEDASSSNKKEEFSRRKYRSNYIRRLSSFSKSARPESEWLHHFLNSNEFELVCWVLIILNMVVVCLEVQHTGCVLASEFQHVHNDMNDSCTYLMDKSSKMGFLVMNCLFCACFGTEFCLRAYDMKLAALKSGWMWFDCFVVILSVIDAASRMGAAVTMGAINVTALRTVRVARLLRMVRVLRGRPTFQTLFLLMKSITASRHALVWSILLLFCTMTSVGLVMSQCLFGYLADPSVSEADRLAVYDYFGTYTRMLITMTEITLGNWAPPSRVLVNNISQWWGLFIIVYKLLFGFSLVHVTAAVFMAETNRVAADDEVQMMRKIRGEEKTSRVLSELFTEINTSGTELMTLGELQWALEDKLMVGLLEILDIDVNDMEELFQALADQDGKVGREHFIKGILRLRGQAKTSKLAAVAQALRNLDGKVEKMAADMANVAKRLPSSSRGGH